jgi:hypothetical protein
VIVEVRVPSQVVAVVTVFELLTGEILEGSGITVKVTVSGSEMVGSGAVGTDVLVCLGKK